MSIRQQIETAQAEFNKKYGVEFNFDEYEGSVSCLDEGGGATSADQIYRVMFTNLYKQAFANFVDRKIDKEFDFVQMLNEFDKSIMGPYREECKTTENVAPKPFGGWTVSQYLTSVDNFLSDEPLFKPHYATQRYNQGKLGLFQMRAYVNSLRSRDDVSTGELSTVDCYMKAIEKSNSDRALIYKILNPVRLIAEAIMLRSFRSYLEQKTGGKLDTQTNANYASIDAISNDHLIGNARDTVASSKEIALKVEQQRAEPDKQKMTVSSAAGNDDGIKVEDKVEQKETIKTLNNDIM